MFLFIWVQKNKKLFVGGVFFNYLQGFPNCVFNAYLVNVKNGLKLKVVPIGHLTKKHKIMNVILFFPLSPPPHDIM